MRLADSHFRLPLTRTEAASGFGTASPPRGEVELAVPRHFQNWHQQQPPLDFATAAVAVANGMDVPQPGKIP
jgi:hypothetical protein